MPFGNIDIIKKKNFIRKNSLTLLLYNTKQEMLAYHLTKKIQNIKLFALVHQLILPLEKKKVPYILRNYEFYGDLEQNF